jgi:hypothetical protein
MPVIFICTVGCTYAHLMNMHKLLVYENLPYHHIISYQPIFYKCLIYVVISAVYYT